MSNTSEIGAFKVVSESGVASGVRRIEAVAGQAAVEYLQALDAIVKTLAGSLKVKGEDLPARLAALQVCVWRRGAGGRGSEAVMEAVRCMLEMLSSRDPRWCCCCCCCCHDAQCSGRVEVHLQAAG